MTLVMDGSFLTQAGKVRPGRVSAGVFDEVLSDRPRTGFLLEVGEDGAPGWLTEVVRCLNIAVDAARAEPGWQPITYTAVIRSLEALRDVMSVDSARPSLTPTPEGGLQFEWHDAGWDVEIEIEPDGRVETWGQHLHNGAAFDGPFASTVDCLRVALKEITLHHLADSD